ncbi:MAG: type II secretion system inner membrane protein GspF [Thermodesulfobacteriota bacterium]
MPVYKYKAINENGSNVQGIIDAESVKSASEKLKKEGIYLSSITETKKGKGRSFIPFRGVSSSELAITTRQFSALISAGLPLEASLVALSEQTEDQKLREVLTQVRDRVSEGSSLTNALTEHRNVFSELYTNIVKAGEASGNLDIVLFRLADFLEKSAALKSRVSSALIYPLFMFVIGSGVLFFMMTYVIPRITKIFEESDRSLPFITLVLITISGFLTDHFILILILLGFTVFMSVRFLRSENGKRFIDRLILRLPVFGKLASKVAISRFSRTLGTLIGSGIPLLDALEIGEAVIGNTVFVDALEKVRVSVREGSNLAAPLRDSEVFPPLVTRMIAVGEQTGEMEDMFNKIADIYDLQVETTLSALTSLLEPIMILLIGVVMAFIVFAILLPIFDLTSAIG